MSGTSAQPLAVALAATAAGTFAVANVVQQRVAARLRSEAAFDSAVLLKLLRQPLWLTGLALVAVSLSLQAAALDLGRLVVIEPVLASSLLFALALAAWADHRRMRPIEWLAALATFAGLVVFLSVARPSGGEATAKPGLLGIAAFAAVVAAMPSRPGLRSEEHTSELQSLRHLVCRLLLEKKKHKNRQQTGTYGNPDASIEHATTEENEDARNTRTARMANAPRIPDRSVAEAVTQVIRHPQ